MDASLPPPSSTPPRMQDHVFMSYSSKDRATVDRLAEDLRAQGYLVWVDFEGIHGGERWRQSIADGIHASRVVMVVLSPESIISDWVEVEVGRALGEDKLVIPLLLRPIDKKTIPATHTHLRDITTWVHYRDFTGGYKAAFELLLSDLPQPEAGIPGHCQKLIAQLAERPWGIDHYIQGRAKILPIDASPYEESGARGQPENLLDKLKTSTRTIVLGEPGIGKTVALERLAWELADRVIKREDDTPIVPVIVKLLEYDGQLLDWIRLDLNQFSEIPLQDTDETVAFLKDHRYRCYFLLDGLNEVRPAYRDQIVDDINRLAREYPQHAVVVTSRVQDENWRRLQHTRAFESGETLLVQNIRPEQAQTYLAAHLGLDDGATLWNQLDEKMQELVTTPLLLWLTKEAWIEAKENQPAGTIVRVPDNRGALYREFVARMFRRDKNRQLDMSADQETCMAALQRLALAMHLQQTLTVAHADALACIGDKDTLETIQRTGLLHGEQELRFAPHQTVQEHFAALALQSGLTYANPTVTSYDKRHFRHSAKGLHTLATGRLVTWMRRMGMGRGMLKHARDPWWAETFIQLAGLTDDPNTLARAVAAVNPWLAWWCVDEGQAVDDDTYDLIQRQSMALVRSPEVADRRNAAQTLARFQARQVMEPLALLSFDSEESVSSIALPALIQMGEAGELAVIKQAQFLMKQSGSTISRTQLAQTLTALSIPQVMEPLALLSFDSEESVRSIALPALIQMGEAGELAVISQAEAYMAQPSNAVPRTQIARTLAALSIPQVVPLLEALAFDDDDSVVQIALPAFASLGKDAQQRIFEVVKSLAQSDNTGERRKAAQVLAVLTDAEPVKVAAVLADLYSHRKRGHQIFEAILLNLPLEQRVQWSQRIADVDPRPGVGAGSDGLPDIDWVEIPDDGRWTYQDSDHRPLATFYMSRYPITYAQFQTFVEAPDGIKDGRWWQGLAQRYDEAFKQRFLYANHPRENVNWYQAVAFCRWLSHKLTGEVPAIDDPLSWPVRLPTEEEWEKAARGTDGLIYPYGNAYDPSKANTSDTGIGMTSAVGIFPDGASPYGLLDMSGNVWEWCLTEYGSKSSVDITNTNSRVLRGGAFLNLDLNSRAASRDFRNPQNGNYYYGFRCVRSR